MGGGIAGARRPQWDVASEKCVMAESILLAKRPFCCSADTARPVWRLRLFCWSTRGIVWSWRGGMRIARDAASRLNGEHERMRIVRISWRIDGVDAPLTALLREACETHLVQLRENARAWAQGASHFAMDVRGCRYQRLPVSATACGVWRSPAATGNRSTSRRSRCCGLRFPSRVHCSGIPAVVPGPARRSEPDGGLRVRRGRRPAAPGGASTPVPEKRETGT